MALDFSFKKEILEKGIDAKTDVLISLLILIN